MTYDTGKRILHTGVFERFRLTKSEHKLLVCLSSEKLTPYAEMERYLFMNRSSLSNLKNKLEVKTKFQLRIDTVRGIGYKLKSDLYFE